MKRSLALVLVLLASAGGASAQQVQNIVLRSSFNPVGAGARGLGMGGAFIAVADDGSAASFNPAGLAQLRRSELTVVGFTDQLQSTLSVPRPEGTETRVRSDRHSAPDFFGLAVPFEAGGRNLTVQVSYQRAVDLFGRGSAIVINRVSFKDVGINRPGAVDVIGDINPEQTGAFHALTLAGAYQLTSRFSVGTSVNYWIGDWRTTGTTSLRLVTPIVRGQTPVDLSRIETVFDQDHGMSGVNVNAGFLLRYPWLSIGAIARLPFSADYELRENVRRTESGLGASATPSNESLRMATSLHWPRSAGIGIALRPFRGITLAADYTTSRWSSTVVDDVPDGAFLTTQPEVEADGDAGQTSFTDRNFFDLLPASQTATVDTAAARAGLEYLLPLSKLVVPLRVGVFTDETPVASLGTDEGRRIDGFTVGTGLNFSRLVFDVTYERRKSSGGVGLRLREGASAQGNTEEQVRETRVVASILYRFPDGDRDPIKRLLRHLFVGGE